MSGELSIDSSQITSIGSQFIGRASDVGSAGAAIAAELDGLTMYDRDPVNSPSALRGRSRAVAIGAARVETALAGVGTQMETVAREAQAADQHGSLCMPTQYDPHSFSFPPWTAGDRNWDSHDPFDVWRDDDWVTPSLTNHEGRTFLSLPNGQPVPVFVPHDNYVNGIDRDGNEASYRTNWLLEERDWVTTGTIRSVTEIPTIDTGSWWAGIAIATTGKYKPLLSADPRAYSGAQLLPNGAMAVGSTSPLFLPDAPGITTPPNDNFDDGRIRRMLNATYRKPSPIDPIDASTHDRVGAAADGISIGLDMADVAFNLNNANHYSTQVLIQENGVGDQRAIVIVSQIREAGMLNPTTTPELHSSYVQVGHSGEIVRHPISIPTDFTEANAVPTMSAKGPEILPAQRFEPFYSYHIGQPAPEDQAVRIDDLGYTVPGTPITPSHPHFVGPIAPSATDQMRELIEQARAEDQN